VETTHRITGEKTYAPLGDLANLEGRVAGENMATGSGARFPGTIQTGICKVFDYAVGSTGLPERAATASGYDDIETVINASPDKPNPPFILDTRGPGEYEEMRLVIGETLIPWEPCGTASMSCPRTASGISSVSARSL
jgi:NADPH-dependent 2,4-dienoyl-CoA reductase/sulfur reductase-like enzyme